MAALGGELGASAVTGLLSSLFGGGGKGSRGKSESQLGSSSNLMNNAFLGSMVGDQLFTGTSSEVANIIAAKSDAETRGDLLKTKEKQIEAETANSVRDIHSAEYESKNALAGNVAQANNVSGKLQGLSNATTNARLALYSGIL